MADAKNKKSEEHYTTTQTNDPVNHPAHYTTGKIEVIDYIEDQKLPYHLGNAVNTSAVPERRIRIKQSKI